MPFHGWVTVQDSHDRRGRTRATRRAGRPVRHRGRRRGLVAGLRQYPRPFAFQPHPRQRRRACRSKAGLQVIEREQAQLTDEQAYVGALATYAEAMLSGTTSIVDMCVRPEPALAAARDIGIRAMIVPYVADTKPFAPTLEQNARLLEARRRQRWPRSRLGRSARPGELQRRRRPRRRGARARAPIPGCIFIARRRSFSVERTRGARRPHAGRPLGWSSAHSMPAPCWRTASGPRRTIARCSRSAGAHVAHCPHANLKLGSGVAPIPDMRRRGMNVSLATDGAKANNRLDMFDVMKFASLLHKGVAGDPTILPPGDIFDMATRSGAAALGLPVGAVVARAQGRPRAGAARRLSPPAERRRDGRDQLGPRRAWAGCRPWS